MKKNTLVQNLGFADLDHKNAKHDAAIHFIKQPEILIKIIENLKIEYPVYTPNKLQGPGFEKNVPFVNAKILRLENIEVETEVIVSKGKNPENKYAIGFLDGVIRFDAIYDGMCHFQKEHGSHDMQITKEEIMLIESKKHGSYLSSSESSKTLKRVFYTNTNKQINIELNLKPNLICSQGEYYMTSSRHFIDKECRFLKAQRPSVSSILEGERSGNVYFSCDICTLVEWDDDPYKRIVCEKPGIIHEFIVNQDQSFKIISNNPCRLENAYESFYLRDNGCFSNDNQESLMCNGNFFLLGAKNDFILTTCTFKQWEINVPLQITQRQIFHVETKFYPTSAGDIIRQIKLYDEYLIPKKPWLVLTFFVLSNLEQEELKAAGLHWIHLGGSQFNIWYDQKQKEKQVFASLSF